MNSKPTYTENTLRRGHSDPGAEKLARGLGWRYARHRTDQPASSGLMTLYSGLAPRRAGA